jgi:hypothetical protein
MKPIQLILLFFVFFALVKVILRHRHREMRRFQFLFWVVVWVGAAVIISHPDTSTFVADLVGIGRGADLIIYVSFLIAFYLIFRIHLMLNRVEQEITQIVSTMALEQLREPINPGSERRAQPGT